MGGRGSSESSTYDIYLYQISDSTGSGRTKGAARTHREHASRTLTRRQRDRAATHLKRKAAEFLAQAGELRKVVAHLSTPENLMSRTVFAFFEDLIPRLNSIYQITEHSRQGCKRGTFSSGIAGFEFLLRVVKNLIRQIESALALSELESSRCRRRPAYFDVCRLLAQASRGARQHYLAGEVGLTARPASSTLQIRGKRSLWNQVFIDLICRAEELSPRKGIAVRLKPIDQDAVSLTLVPRGALLSTEDTRLREQRQKLLGRVSPPVDPTFAITRSIVHYLGGRLVTGKNYRSYIMPLFTLDIPTSPPELTED